MSLQLRPLASALVDRGPTMVGEQAGQCHLANIADGKRRFDPSSSPSASFFVCPARRDR
jgi:hypothetical protein